MPLLSYWFIFVLWMMAAIAYNGQAIGVYVITRQHKRATLASYLLASVTALFIGLRFEIGADWFTYLANYDMIQLMSYGQALTTFDAGYATLVFIAGRMGIGIWLVNLVCGLIMVLGVLRFCSRQYNPALTFLVAVPYLLIVVGMGYTRQGVAIGIVLAGLADADGRSSTKLVLFVLAAALFHRTALLVLPLALAPLARRNQLQAIFGAVVSAALFILLLRQSTDQLMATYITDNYESGGAIVRVAMNLPPALLVLVLGKRLGFSTYQQDMWRVFAIVAIATFPLVVAANFTTAIDRLALFLIPLQLAILPRLPYVLAGARHSNAQLLLAVCGYSAAIQSVWLVFATHASYWVPYKNVIFDA